jgi:protoheme IX farnesyltransferase
MHPINTWVGTIVGAVPPLMGWTAVTNSLDPGAFFLAGLLYFWQLPHFMALAWMCKTDYIKGGYKMLSALDPSGRRTAGVAQRNALAIVPLSLAAVGLGLTQNAFAYEAFALSGVFVLTASAFYVRPCQQVPPHLLVLLRPSMCGSVIPVATTWALVAYAGPPF